MPIEKEPGPAKKVSRTYVPPDSTTYKVKDGDSWGSIAKVNSIDAMDLIELNFKTRNPDEVNWYLKNYVGCTLATADRKNWRFSSSAKPGIIHVPKKGPSLFYTVPGMRLIPQDKTMSCWFASGQMLIAWRANKKQASEADHPDPALVAKWSKLYDDNPGIGNKEIQAFANDLGLEMVGRVTPSPQYVKDLLMLHGPLWVNGKSHITVIAGIREAAGGGIEVLVFDPDKPTLVNGAWRDFYDHYGLAGNTGLDASTDAPTSMLYLGD